MAKTRYPLVQALMSRGSSAYPGPGNPDPFVLNGYMDTYNNKQYVVKRPGFIKTSFTPLNAPCTGLFNYQGLFYYTANSPIVGPGDDILVVTSGSTFAGTNGTAFTQVTTNPNPPWAARRGFGCVSFQGLMYVICGYILAQPATASDVYSTANGIQWSVVASSAPFPPRFNFGCVVFKNKI